MRAGMSRKTARKYAFGGKLPSERVEPRDWRTRGSVPRALAGGGGCGRVAGARRRRRGKPSCCSKYPGTLRRGQLRTLQRRVKTWQRPSAARTRSCSGSCCSPGEAAQTDHVDPRTAVTIAGQLFVHMLCVVVLPYSRWRWASVTFPESIAALRHGVQRALFQLGRVPEWHQTDNSTRGDASNPRRQERRRRRRPANDRSMKTTSRSCGTSA